MMLYCTGRTYVISNLEISHILHLNVPEYCTGISIYLSEITGVTAVFLLN